VLEVRRIEVHQTRNQGGGMSDNEDSKWPDAVAHLGCFALIGWIALLLFRACVA
jgi:hypothetical protein